MASSADGTRLVTVASGGPIYISVDSGSTWTLTDAPITNWTSVACSADGTRLVAASRRGGIYVAQLAPKLTIHSSGTAAVLSWTGAPGRFVLQSASDLNSANWQALTNSVGFDSLALKNVVTDPIAGGNRFYRLSSP